MKNDYVKEYWEEKGRTHGESHLTSWGDKYMIDLEIANISKYIGYRQSVLDVGCGNGYSTVRQAADHLSSSFTGIDFAEGLISIAKKLLSPPNVNFYVGDALSIDFDNDTFDVVYTTRTLINILTWEEQIKAIKECIRVAIPGGKVILSEAFWEPMQVLNAMRLLRNLAPITMHDFNRYLRMSALEEFLQTLEMKYHIDDFSSVYYLGTRFFRQLVEGPDSYKDYDSSINVTFYNLEKRFDGGGMGIQQAVVITKPN